jgi:hypothetical protein
MYADLVEFFEGQGITFFALKTCEPVIIDV